MNKLQVLVHVCTAYSNPHKTIIEEKVHPPDNDLWKVMKNIAVGEHEIKSQFQNAYSYSCNLAENSIFKKYYDRDNDFTAAIVRTGFICSSAREPFKGEIKDFKTDLKV